ncbi:MAG: citrate/2-methylcitrate synthase [Clostridia bacterium]|nr:citrate/2-methylcitrate synthase [Clostridia bacterium]
MALKSNDELFNKLCSISKEAYKIDPSFYEKYSVKRGLRNSNGSGVLVGLTKIGDVHGYLMDEGEKRADEGILRYRGIDVSKIVRACQKENRFGFEEVAYLLLFGALPSKDTLKEFTDYIGSMRDLPPNFTEDMILKAPSGNIMNKLARCVLASYSYDYNPDDTSVENVLRQSFELIARMPTMIAHAYQAKAHYYDNKSLILHSPDPDLSTAENFLRLMRPTGEYTMEEAQMLDLALILHAEHGGGNNSAFTTHVVSSTGTDTYSAVAAAIGALKGPKHGGANEKVMGMIRDFKENITDITDEKQIREHIIKLYRKESYDHSGLVYGIGHAIYTKSDPRASLLRESAGKLAKEKNMEDELLMYDLIAKNAIELFTEITGKHKDLAINVDFYSGFIYQMLNIPPEVYTPIFAMSRITGWCAHRLEEIMVSDRIIRPAYKNVHQRDEYVDVDNR